MKWKEQLNGDCPRRDAHSMWGRKISQRMSGKMLECVGRKREASGLVLDYCVIDETCERRRLT
jgi:hypothetical protein